MFDFNAYNKLGKDARKAMIVSNFVSIIICTVVLIVIRFIIHAFNIPQRVFLVYDIVAIMIFIFFIIIAILQCTLEYNRNRYKISDVSVETMSGVIFLSKKVIPIRRIQQVSVSSGPIVKMFNLCDLEIVTAGGNVIIEYLPTSVAEEIATKLREDINEFAEKQLLNQEGYRGVINDIDKNEISLTLEKKNIMKDINNEDVYDSDACSKIENIDQEISSSKSYNPIIDEQVDDKA